MLNDYDSFYENSNALLIGVNNYEHPGFRALDHAEDDAVAFAELLSNPPYSFTTHMLLGHYATKSAIQEELHELRSCHRNDRVLIYFACHGYTLSDKHGRDTGYLACADTLPDRDFTALALDEITSVRNYSAAKHISFIFDACYSSRALGLGRGVSQPASDKFLAHAAHQALAAGSEMVPDYHSMTTYMLDALRNNDAVDPTTGLCTLTSLGSYLKHTIAALGTHSQIPVCGHLIGSEDGEFVFAYREVSFPPDIESGLRSWTPKIRKGAVEAIADLMDEPTLAVLARQTLQRIVTEDDSLSVREASRVALARVSPSSPTKAAEVVRPTAALPSFVSFKSYVGALPHGALLRIGKGGLNDCALSNDGAVIGAVGNAGIYIFAAQDAAIQWSVSAEQPMQTIGFSPDARWVAVGSVNGRIRLWDSHEGQLIHILTTDSSSVTCLRFSPDNLHVAAGSADSLIRVWNINTGLLMQRLEGHSQSVRCCAFSPSGELLASGADDGSICLWETASGVLRGVFENIGTSVLSIAFSPDETLILSGADDGVVRIWWNTATCDVHSIMEGFEVCIRALAVSPDGATIAVGLDDGRVNLIDMITREVAPQQLLKQSAIISLQFSANNRELLVATTEGEVGWWDMRTHDEIEFPAGFTKQANTLAVLEGANQLATSHDAGLVLTWDMNSGDLCATLEHPTRVIRSLAFLPDTEVLACGLNDGTIQFWNIRNQQPLQRLEGHLDWVGCLSYAPSRHLLASGSLDNTISLWDMNTHQRLKTLMGHMDEVTNIAFVAEGDKLISVSHDRTIRMWNTHTGKVEQVLMGEQDFRNSAICAQRNWVATGSEIGLLRLWDMETAKPKGLFEAHQAPITALAFSDDGRLLISGAYDNTIRIWDTITLECLKVLEGHSLPITTIVFHDNWVFSSSQDGTIISWSVSNLR